MKTLNTHVAYTETITNGADTATAVLAAHQADQLVERGQRLRCDINVTTTGVITIDRPTMGIRLELVPTLAPTLLTKTQATDLSAVDAHRARLDRSGGDWTIVAGFHRVPPAATRRLLERGWVSVLALEQGATVRVSVAGRVALVLRDHRTLTTDPQHTRWSVDSGRASRRRMSEAAHKYVTCDGRSMAICSCRWRQSNERRAVAVAAAREHRTRALSEAIQTIR